MAQLIVQHCEERFCYLMQWLSDSLKCANTFWAAVNQNQAKVGGNLFMLFAYIWRFQKAFIVHTGAQRVRCLQFELAERYTSCFLLLCFHTTLWSYLYFLFHKCLLKRALHVWLCVLCKCTLLKIKVPCWPLWSYKEPLISIEHFYSRRLYIVEKRFFH